ncbi:MAG: glycosyltransferase [Methylococcales bacterium]|nr:glycosyltransferase [Methylococcales bacterium]
MRVIINKEYAFQENVVRYFNFEEFEQKVGDIDLYTGSRPNPQIFEPSKNKKIYFATEEQTGDQDATDQYLDYVDKILTICPPSLTKRQKRVSAFFPISPSYLPDRIQSPISLIQKDCDVIYTGFADVKHLTDIVFSICQFNYWYVSFMKRTGKETHLNISYQEKLDLISRSKICIVHNLIADQLGTRPQLKSRLFEAAFCKSIILCKRDDYNLIEEWFDPNSEFYYWDTKEDLPKTIKYLLDNYERTHITAERAFSRAMSHYTTEKFVEKYLI